MKFNLLCALLALSNLELHSNLLGTKKPVAKFDEDQLQSIEDALAQNDTSALTSQITAHEATISGLNTEAENISTAINDAFALNGLDLPEGTSIAEAIATLGTQCKTYGDSNQSHSIPKTDGLDKIEENKLADGFFDANAPHNQL